MQFHKMLTLSFPWEKLIWTQDPWAKQLYLEPLGFENLSWHFLGLKSSRCCCCIGLRGVIDTAESDSSKVSLTPLSLTCPQCHWHCWVWLVHSVIDTAESDLSTVSLTPLSLTRSQCHWHRWVWLVHSVIDTLTFEYFTILACQLKKNRI